MLYVRWKNKFLISLSIQRMNGELSMYLQYSYNLSNLLSAQAHVMISIAWHIITNHSTIQVNLYKLHLRMKLAMLDGRVHPLFIWNEGGGIFHKQKYWSNGQKVGELIHLYANCYASSFPGSILCSLFQIWVAVWAWWKVQSAVDQGKVQWLMLTIVRGAECPLTIYYTVLKPCSSILLLFYYSTPLQNDTIVTS